jgi:hypothetical protein
VLRAQQPHLTFAGVAGALGDQWRGLPQAQRSKYDALAAQDKLRYEREKAAF